VRADGAGARNEPRVSVLVPSYNHSRFVLGAVQSVLDQTEDAIEVIVIDDGSTDDSLERLATVEDPRLTVLAQPNRGLSRTLNRGLELARGRWVKFLPSDDMLVPTCLSIELRAAEELERGVVFCLPEIVDGEGRPLADPAPQGWFDTAARDGPDLLLGLVERNFLSAPGALFERDAALGVGGFDAEMKVAQDYDLWLKLLPRGVAVLLPERLVRVRWHGANQSAVSTPETESERARALVRALADVGLPGWIERFAQATPGRSEVAGRRALAGALERCGLPELRAVAEQLHAEARRLDRPRPARVLGRLFGQGARAVIRRVRRRLRPRWRVALDAAPRVDSRPAGGAAGIAPGRRRERWLVLDPEPLCDAGGRLRGRKLAAALARRGDRVAHAAPRAVGGPDASEAPGLLEIGWDLASIRSFLADPGGGDRLVLVVEAPHPTAVALAREAGEMGARVVFDRTAAWEAHDGLDWYDAESESSLVARADDLLAAARPVAGRLLAGRRPVHVLPSPGTAEEAMAARAWDAVAASVAQIVDRPAVTVILVAQGRDAALPGAIDALLEARRHRRHRIAVVLTESESSAAAAAIARLDGEEDAVLLRSPFADPGEARALGIRATRGEVVAVLAPTAARRLAGDWLAAPLAVLAEHRDVGAVTLAPGRPGSPNRAADVVPAGAGGGQSPMAPAWHAVDDLDPAAILIAPRALLVRLIHPGEATSSGAREPGDRELARRFRSASYRLAALT
jgi:GT2 family glycosyltransferase